MRPVLDSCQVRRDDEDVTTTKNLSDVQTGERLQVADGESLVWVAVDAVEISYTAKGPDTVDVTFADGYRWSRYPADMQVKVR